MGVDISGLIEGKPISLEDLSGRSIAIDAFNLLDALLFNRAGPPRAKLTYGG